MTQAMTRIILEGSRLSVDVAGGVVTYINNLFEQYQIHEANYRIQSYILLLNKLPSGNSLNQSEHEARKSIVKTYFRFIKSILFGFPEQYVLFHSPYMFLPPRQKGRINLLTVLDMINFEKPFGIRNKFREISLRLAIKRADYYICISEATKEKLQTYFPSIKDHQIIVTHLGIDNNFLSPSTSMNFANLVNTPYLLYVGQRGGYKNFDSLIPFMAQSPLGKKLKILCVGGGPFSKQELALLNRHQLDNAIQH